MLKIRRYQDADREAVWALHNTALLGVGAHPGSGEWDADLRDIPGEYFDRGGEFIVDPELDWADFEYDIPLGGKSMDEDVRLIVRGRLQFEVGSLEVAGTWIQEDPAGEITKRLWDEWIAAEAIAAKEREKSVEKQVAEKIPPHRRAE